MAFRRHSADGVKGKLSLAEAAPSGLLTTVIQRVCNLVHIASPCLPSPTSGIIRRLDGIEILRG
ncbi:MAG: hypothetical protein KAW49_03415, partial [Anaerolineae bacterium]|nr:hypothetical protein [Anaerolineae bacterium]